MADFEKEIKAKLDAQLLRECLIVGGTAAALLEAVVNGTQGLSGTPYDTGIASSNWFVEVNGISGKTTDDMEQNNLPLAQSTILTALSTGKSIKYFSLFNNLPYIRHLEYGLYPNPPKKPTGKTEGGYSTLAPQGMFRIAINKWETLLKEERNSGGGSLNRQLTRKAKAKVKVKKKRGN